MQIPEEDLIAFLLGDASPIDAEKITRLLETDSVLRERIARLSEMLHGLKASAADVEPPEDLVDATLARISRECPVARVSLQPVSLAAHPRWMGWDSPALGLSLAVLCCLILPAVVRARYVSRKLQCAANLQNTGQSLSAFASNQPDNRFPGIPLSGREAFAGYFTIRLAGSGLPISAGQLFCPSRIGLEPLAEFPQYMTASGPVNLSTMTETELADFQRMAAGDYAYTLGVTVGGRVVAPHQQGNSHFPILADAPLISQVAAVRELDSPADADRFASDFPVDSSDQFIAHDGQGINILYADGRVLFLNCSALEPSSRTAVDYPFSNLRGTHEAGLSPEDASLAPSHFPPVAK